MQAISSAPFGVLGSWQVDIGANLLIGITFLTIALLILGPLWRMRQLLSNPLASVAAAVFLCSGVGRLGQAVHVSLMGGAVGDALHIQQSWQAGWDVVTAVVAVMYLSMRKRQAGLLDTAPLFDDLAHVQHVTELAAVRAQRAARAEAEAERDASATMLKSIIANSQSAIYVKDLQGRYLMTNPPLLEILGKSESEVLGQTDQGHVGQAEQLWRLNDTRAESGPFRVVEWNDDFADGRRYFDSVKFPLHDPDGALYATCGVSLDVTRLTRALESAAEDRDLAVAAAAAKSTFLATMSHEIRTPMNAVIGLTDLLTDTDLDEVQQELVTTVRSSGETLMAIINDILDFSKIESGELRLESAPFWLRDEVEGCLDLVVMTANAKGLEVVCHVDESCPDRVIGDVLRLRQILINLLSNAVKFTEQGEVIVSVTASPTGHNQIQLAINVTDTGIGITPAGLERVFSSFSQVDASITRTHGGTGLGLAITQSLAHAMHGEATIASTPGAGTSVTVTVVLDVPPDPEIHHHSTDTSAESLAGKSVLIVDDNRTNLDVLALQLAGLGMTCTPSASAWGALALVADGLTYDVALLDTEMPDFDGPELSAALRGVPTGAHPPHILLTSMGGHPPDPTHSYAGFLTKPVKLRALREALLSVLTTRADDYVHVPDPWRFGTSRPEQHQPLRVLLAEDNPVNQRVAKLILDKLGQPVDIVGDGSEAVEAVQNREYDVVLMDMQMPHMDGLEAARRIRTDLGQQQLCIVAITANAQLEDRDACLAAGMDRYLSKPIRATELERVLAEVRGGFGRPVQHDEEAATVYRRPSSSSSGIAPQTTHHTAQNPDSRPPAIDLTVFDELISELGDAEDTLRGELIDSYLADTSSQLEQLHAAARESNFATMARIAHTVRSTSALMGIRVLAQLLLQIETAVLSNPTSLEALTEQIGIEYARVTEALNTLTNRVIESTAGRDG